MDIMTISFATPRKQKDSSRLGLQDSSINKEPHHRETVNYTNTNKNLYTNSHELNCPSVSKTNNSSQFSDRFIPRRSGFDFEYCNHELVKAEIENFDTRNQICSKSEVKTPSTSKSNIELLQSSSNVKKRLLDCFDSRPDSINEKKMRRTLKEHSEAVSITRTPKKECRYIASVPIRVLDAPDLMDDYYLNLLSWGKNNVIAIALKQAVYLWNASDKSISQLMELENDDFVSSVQWSSMDGTMAVGTSMNTVQIWDAERQKMIREIQGHEGRVSSLSWNGSIISSGSRDTTIRNNDVRIRHSLQSAYISHTQEVCGLTWSPDGLTLASGGNDNALCLWDSSMSAATSASNQGNGIIHPRSRIEQHQAAVKALAWCPFQRHTLASGGGTADRTIRIWDSASGANLKCVDTGSQVCAIQWSDTEKELVSSHGFSDNQLCIWKYPTMTKIRELRGHTARVLHLAKSPDGKSILSAGADETLRFWEVFGDSSSSKGGMGSTTKTPGNLKHLKNVLVGSSSVQSGLFLR